MIFEGDSFVITEEEEYGQLVSARSAGLLNILVDELAFDADLTLGVNGLPAIDLTNNGRKYRLAYFPVGPTDSDNYILVIRSTIEASSEDADNFLTCASFNASAIYAFAVPMAGTSNIELRAAIPEQEGLNTVFFYEYILNMFFESESELIELVNE